MVSQFKIPTYIINLRNRTDRKKNIEKEFSEKDEFKATIVEAIEGPTGAIGLWNTIKHILANLVNESEEFILICEDDHQFTDNYSKEFLFECINEAKKNGADVLCGGVSWFTTVIQISERLFWMQKFSGLQFTILFKASFSPLLEAHFGEYDDADYKISKLVFNKFVIHPFISVQKDYGYSDVTIKNNIEGRVEGLFNKSSGCIQNLKDVSQFYKIRQEDKGNEPENYENIAIPTYVINLSERTDRREHILKQFLGKDEFAVTIVEAIRHEIGAYGLWRSIRRIIELAIINDDDIIIICEDDHEFTKHYSRDFLLNNIIHAHAQGADILSGGIGHFSHAVPVTQNRFWIGSFFSTQFLVLYRKFFQTILDEPYNESVTADDFLSKITSNKMVLFPFISTQKEFGYSDVTERNNNEEGLITRLFTNTANRLEIIQRIRNRYFGDQRSSLCERPLEELITDVDNTYLPETRAKIKPSFQCNLSPTSFSLNLPKNRIVVLIPFYNSKDFILECYESLIMQDYNNFKLIFLDDCSTDGGIDLIPDDDSRIVRLTLPSRSYALFNIYQGLSGNSLMDEDIIAIIDGDDFLLHNQVFNRLNEIYHTKNCLISYGQYFTTAGQLGHSKSYTKDEFELIRELDWRASHLKTFKYKVYNEFLRQDLSIGSYKDDDGQFYIMSYDIALMTPLLEIAGYENVYFNNDLTYGYRLHANNDVEIDKTNQFDIADKIRKKSPFRRCF